MKKILIGTHNNGKFKEISYLISKKILKISPSKLKIISPKETGKTFFSNARLKANFFSKFVNYPVISDDSGLCIESLNNKPGIYSARLAKKHGGFFNAMKFYNKKDKEITRRHKNLIRGFQDKTKLSDYQILWLTFAKGLLIGAILL